MAITQRVWGVAPGGGDIVLFEMTNPRGASVWLSNAGAGIVSVIVPDREGNLADVCLGYEKPESYLGDGPCMGKTPGRYANRIAFGKFTLDGREYSLATNNGPNHLHGGPDGFANRLWTGRVEGERVIFALVSPDGDEGYPGEVRAEVAYAWSDDDRLTIEYSATASAPTVINLTNHAYFNLRGEGAGSEAMLAQTLQLNAMLFLVTDQTQIPTGEMGMVAGTPMDFRTARPIGERIAADYEPLRIGAGYDHCWVVDGWKKGKLSEIGTLADAGSGRYLKIFSTQPGVQIYTGNWLAGSPAGKNGRSYANRDGVAIECQAFPDSPNKPQFPSTVLRPGETYRETIVFEFGA